MLRNGSDVRIVQNAAVHLQRYRFNAGRHDPFAALRQEFSRRA
jgi:hypothetical protein